MLAVRALVSASFAIFSGLCCCQASRALNVWCRPLGKRSDVFYPEYADNLRRVNAGVARGKMHGVWSYTVMTELQPQAASPAARPPLVLIIAWPRHCRVFQRVVPRAVALLLPSLQGPVLVVSERRSTSSANLLRPLP